MSFNSFWWSKVTLLPRRDIRGKHATSGYKNIELLQVFNEESSRTGVQGSALAVLYLQRWVLSGKDDGWTDGALLDVLPVCGYSAGNPLESRKLSGLNF